MKGLGRAVFLGGCLLLIVILVCTAQAEETMVDVVEGELRVLNYRIPLLEGVEKPVTMLAEDGNVLLRVQTADGEVVINAGKGTMVLTRRAYPFIEVITPPSPTPEATRKTETRCGYCGEPMKGHRCPVCNLRYCKHDDIACGYRLNPAPSPNITTGPDGTVIKGPYWSPDGKFIVGPPTGENKPEYEVWSPGLEYEKAHATPTPSPTIPAWVFATPTAQPFNGR